MMYPFMTLNDNTEIVHSEMKPDGRVKVYVERPVMRGFDSAECWLPRYQWANITGFSEKEIAYFQELLESTAHIIIELSQEGGLTNAANL